MYLYCKKYIKFFITTMIFICLQYKYIWISGSTADKWVQVELDELEGSSMLATTVAWDDSLSLTWEKAIDALQNTMRQVGRYMYIYLYLVYTLIFSAMQWYSNIIYVYMVRDCMQVSSFVVKMRNQSPNTFIVSKTHSPSKKYWELTVNRVLQEIDRRNSELTKVCMLKINLLAEIIVFITL